MTGKFYTLGILRSLNSRPGLRDWMTSDDMGRTSLSGWQWGEEHENAVARRPSEVRFSLQSPGDIETEKALRRRRLDALPRVSICIACSRTMHLAKEQQHGFREGVAFHPSGSVQMWCGGGEPERCSATCETRLGLLR
jgi:hypothetical protein